MPPRPQLAYSTWTGWRAFLGTETRAAGRAYTGFEEARALAQEWARINNLTSPQKWRRWARTNKTLLREHRIPANPNIVLQYRQAVQGFTSWANWLGTNVTGTEPHLHD